MWEGVGSVPSPPWECAWPKLEIYGGLWVCGEMEQSGQVSAGRVPPPPTLMTVYPAGLVVEVDVNPRPRATPSPLASPAAPSLYQIKFRVGPLSGFQSVKATHFRPNNSFVLVTSPLSPTPVVCSKSSLKTSSNSLVGRYIFPVVCFVERLLLTHF